MVRFNLPEGHDEQQIEEFLTGDFAFAVGEPVVQQRALYDTFDWRLFSRSLTLFHAGHELALRRLWSEFDQGQGSSRLWRRKRS